MRPKLAVICGILCTLAVVAASGSAVPPGPAPQVSHRAALHGDNQYGDIANTVIKLQGSCEQIVGVAPELKCQYARTNCEQGRFVCYSCAQLSLCVSVCTYDS